MCFFPSRALRILFKAVWFKFDLVRMSLCQIPLFPASSMIRKTTFSSLSAPLNLLEDCCFRHQYNSFVTGALKIFAFPYIQNRYRYTCMPLLTTI